MITDITAQGDMLMNFLERCAGIEASVASSCPLAPGTIEHQDIDKVTLNIGLSP